MSTVVESFESIGQYVSVIEKATIAAYEKEEKDIEDFNNANHMLHAWIIYDHPERGLVFRVEPRKHMNMMPRPGDACKVKFTYMGKDLPGITAENHTVERSTDVIKLERGWEKTVEFCLPKDTMIDATHFMVKKLDDAANIGKIMDKSIRVCMKLKLSETTKRAELGALARVKRAFDIPLGMLGRYFQPPYRLMTEKQKNAVRKFILMGHQSCEDIPAVNLVDWLKHLEVETLSDPNLVSLLERLSDRFDPHQAAAHRSIIRGLRGGVAFIAGGAGSGKTTFTLRSLAMAMASKEQRVRVLCLVDINSTLDDVTRKMEDLRKNFNLDHIKVIRMLKWPQEMKRGKFRELLDDLTEKKGKVEESKASGETLDKTNSEYIGRQEAYEKADADFKEYLNESAGSTLRTLTQELQAVRARRDARKQRDPSHIPTLDEEACELLYDEITTEKYDALRQVVLPDEKPMKLNDFTYEKMLEVTSNLDSVYDLYCRVLQKADFVATTPVAAFCHFSVLFKPDIVVFDEAGHAREPSTLIALTLFEPKIWLFIGDYRQIAPYVLDDPKSEETTKQLKLSALERADNAHRITAHLMINHRARGELVNLPSSLFYDDRLVSGIPKEEQFTENVPLIKSAMECLIATNGQKENSGEEKTSDDKQENAKKDTELQCTRLLVNSGIQKEWRSKDPGRHKNDRHIKWIARQAGEFLHKPQFTGTIMIVTLYAMSANKHNDAIKHLKKQFPGRIEALTAGKAQGREASIVFFDAAVSLAHAWNMDPKRLCVALTRGCEGEFVIMSETLIDTLAEEAKRAGLQNEYARIANLCKQGGKYGGYIHMPSTLNI